MSKTDQVKVALVTGGASGIGRAAAGMFAREGLRVAVADMDNQGGEETVRQIEQSGGEAFFIKVDVSDPVEAQEMIKMVIDAYGRLDKAFNNAGVEGTANVLTHDYSEDIWDKVVSINLKGVWLCMKYEIPEMLKQGAGAIVNTASIAGLRANAVNGAAYIASKHGVIGLTKTSAVEYARRNIRVNAVCPGAIHTPMAERILGADYRSDDQYFDRLPSGRMGTPIEIAEAVVWLCSDAASFVTGHSMAVDGGSFAR